MNIPNKITLVRVCLIPAFLVVYMAQPFALESVNAWLALILFSVAAITDALDGYLARKLKLVTNFGKLMYEIHKNLEVADIYNQLVTDFIRLGFLKNTSDNQLIVNIPIISEKEYDTLTDINNEYKQKYLDLLGNRLNNYIVENIIDCPKHINPAPPHTHLHSFSEIALTYIKKANDVGFINLDDKKNYPICMLVEKELKKS